MRLSKIKLAGFKSFVDPTVLDLRSNLVGILGPNGCGKSNTIDAVRWVMGESSAKHLRGQSMEDVIFNGSSSRKPVGQASVELVFDNSDKTLGGEYAAFNELSIKRLVSRDGQSKYFLNGSRCRRRDITDIFLGTGLGPRSYAIIEQGMISRLIDAKPEELRVYIEEAAGISKYKERRRETENRIKHTRENLDRLGDLREEVDKQLARLKRQSEAAEKFKEYKEQERKLDAGLCVMKWQALDTQLNQQQRELDISSTEHQGILTELRSTEARLEEERLKREEANDIFNDQQGEYYRVGAEITRLEQVIQHQKDLQARHKQDLQQSELAISKSRQQLVEDEEVINELDMQLEALEPELEEQNEALMLANEQVEFAEEASADWQDAWLALKEKINEPTQQAQIEKNRMEQLEANIAQRNNRLDRLQNEAERHQDNDFLDKLESLKEKYELEEERHLQLQQLVQVLTDEQNHFQQKHQTEQKELADKRLKLQSMQGKLSSLEALQQAGLGADKKDKALENWLEQTDLSEASRLGEIIQIEDGWQKALEVVLGADLQAICISELDNYVVALEDKKPESLMLFESVNVANQTIPMNSLGNKVTYPYSLKGVLQHVECAESLNEALASRKQLADNAFIITKEGHTVGKHWVKLATESRKSDGILARQEQIKNIKAEYQTLEEQIQQLEESVENALIESKQKQQEKEAIEQEYNQLHREISQLKAEINNQQHRYEQAQYRIQEIQRDIEELIEQLENDKENYDTAITQRNRALEELEALSFERDELDNTRNEVQASLTQAKTTAQDLQEQVQAHRFKIESIKSNKANLLQTVQRLQQQLQEQESRYEELLEAAHDDDSISIESTQEQLEGFLVEHQLNERKLTEARESLQSIDTLIRELDQKRLMLEQKVDAYRDKLEQQKLQWQETKVREQTLAEQFAETGFALDEIESELPDDIKQQEKSLEQVQQRIQRLGSINLAAIEEYQEEKQRKEYLDQQNDDLETALETLEKAIAKIDKDTRGRFRETFDYVNSRVGQMFPKLFGGGEARLEMTGDDLLTTGVAIMARPPGKKISSIQLMSGGEKALTAVAMVFAIFELNPAPFCMLDEVDAPLDEANVGRFCDLVREMSSQVQFIFITHNKATMELAENLVGVTMRESGVSRLVSVDLEEAVKVIS